MTLLPMVAPMTLLLLAQILTALTLLAIVPGLWRTWRAAQSRRAEALEVFAAGAGLDAFRPAQARVSQARISQARASI